MQSNCFLNSLCRRNRSPKCTTPRQTLMRRILTPYIALSATPLRRWCTFAGMLLLHGELEKVLRPHCQSSLKCAQGVTAMGLFNSRKKQEQAYITALDIPSCLKEDFKLVVEETFTIVGIGTVATGHVLTGMCRIGEKAYVITPGTTALETTITTIDVHTKERQSNGCAYKTEHIGIGLRGISKEQLEKGTEIIVKNANQYAM